MISKVELLSIADQTGLTPNVVEKDYVLGWLLGAINANPVLSQSWVFKGGTCLKKCFIETYRFSEDLDFTIIDGKHLNKEFLISRFTEISNWLYEAIGIEFPVDKFIFEIYKNPRNNESCQGRIYYKSFFSSGKNSLPKIKIDLTADEILVMTPSRQKVFHPYTQDGEVFLPH